MQTVSIAPLSIGVMCVPSRSAHIDRNFTVTAPARGLVHHLKAVELSIRIRDQIERRVLRRREQACEPFTYQIGMGFGDA
jgi:hypothetical protein